MFSRGLGTGAVGEYAPHALARSQVHHPKASEAFRRAFAAMKTLIDERSQAARRLRIEKGVRGVGEGGPDGADAAGSAEFDADIQHLLGTR